MESKESIQEIENLISELETTHLWPGSSYQRVNSIKALLNLNNGGSEVDIIYNLVEAHSPSLRYKTVSIYEDILKTEKLSASERKQLKLCIEALTTKCSAIPREKKIDNMLNQIKDLPKEWSLIQFTPQFNPDEVWNSNNDVYYTNSIHISVFFSGSKENPFVVTAAAPISTVTGQPIGLCEEFISIDTANTEFLKSNKIFKNQNAKLQYKKHITNINDRLKQVIKDVQNLWLKEWRCLLVGKFCDDNIEMEIKKQFEVAFKKHAPQLQLSKRDEYILCCLAKTFNQLGHIEVENIVKYCFSNADEKLIKTMIITVTNTAQKLYLEYRESKKYPVVLILHDSLDFIPWEMIDVLQNQPITRVPSLHFLYCLYKEHESEIVGGYKIVKDYTQGRYLVNPGKDLVGMEARILKFFKYWTPDWTGISGRPPTKDEFFELLSLGEIFSYNGHSSGTRYMSRQNVQKSHINTVVFLFGCSSVRSKRIDPQLETLTQYDSFLIARCPCVVGMLWNVPDKITDLVNADLMTFWLPSKASKHWKYVDRQKWLDHQEITFTNNPLLFGDEYTWEPDLLQALTLAKKFVLCPRTKGALVAKGLPVKVHRGS